MSMIVLNLLVAVLFVVSSAYALRRMSSGGVDFYSMGTGRSVSRKFEFAVAAPVTLSANDIQEASSFAFYIAHCFREEQLFSKSEFFAHLESSEAIRFEPAEKGTFYPVYECKDAFGKPSLNSFYSRLVSENNQALFDVVYERYVSHTKMQNEICSRRSAAIEASNLHINAKRSAVGAAVGIFNSPNRYND